MSIDNVVTILVAVLGSGIISLIIQRHWAKVDEKKAQEKEQSEEAKREKAERELNNRMIKKLFRANLTRTINSVRGWLDDDTISQSQLLLYVSELHDDMEDYFEMGGNGATHAAYLQLYKEISEKKPELISVAWLESMSAEIKP